MEVIKQEKKRNGIRRAVIAALAILVQIAWSVLLMLVFESQYKWLSGVVSVIAVLVVLALFARNTNSAFKLPWIILILIVPMFGLILYFLTGHSSYNKWQIRTHLKTYEDLLKMLPDGSRTIRKLEESRYGRQMANQARYVYEQAGFTPYLAQDGNDITYYSSASECYEQMLEDILEAQSFVLLEYYAIENAKSFRRMEEILAKKTKEGVTVRILYDEIGSIGFINRDFVKKMTSIGVECKIFNPIVPMANVLMNNRDHRKIAVIDGRIGYTGGFNLADEYFNIVKPYGYWKDTAVRLRGECVKNLTITFLESWNSMGQALSDKEKEFITPPNPDVELDREIKADSEDRNEPSLILPFADTPIDETLTGENVYMNIIGSASDYLWFSSPYLIVDDEMIRALTLAAARGVDVRILIPAIPDKKIIYRVTRSYASILAQGGVKIYHYTPGFNHAKQCVCDDTYAVCGTINLDYRSLYLHFEDAVLFANCDAVTDMKQDFESLWSESLDCTESYIKRKPYKRFFDYVLKLLAPLF